jgi:hypothetical protein
MPAEGDVERQRIGCERSETQTRGVQHRARDRHPHHPGPVGDGAGERLSQAPQEILDGYG